MDFDNVSTHLLLKLCNQILDSLIDDFDSLSIVLFVLLIGSERQKLANHSGLRKITICTFTDFMFDRFSRVMSWETNACIDFLEFKPSKIAAVVAISVTRELEGKEIHKALSSLVMVKEANDDTSVSDTPLDASVSDTPLDASGSSGANNI
ncbi:hypothetical protein Lal_00008103 [Lupinus albus]|nr:hypothetical protein Lal_00008103 [Lupinus albus]